MIDLETKNKLNSLIVTLLKNGNSYNFYRDYNLTHKNRYIDAEKFYQNKINLELKSIRDLDKDEQKYINNCLTLLKNYYIKRQFIATLSVNRKELLNYKNKTRSVAVVLQMQNKQKYENELGKG